MNLPAPKSADIGALSRIDNVALMSAFSGVSSGRVFDLVLEINDRIPNNPGFVRFSLAFTRTPEMMGKISPFQASVEVIVGTLHVSTHMDAFIHIQAEDRIYGGDLASDARDDKGWKKYGMETVPPIIGRGLFLDVAGLKGLERLPDMYEITISDIQTALKAAKDEIRKGDIVIVRTGKILDYGDPEKFLASEPGVGRDAAIWMYEQGMAVLGTDTTGTEPAPFKDPAKTTHRAMLVDRGVHLIENLNLEELGKARATSGLFIALPLKITGATGCWLRPVLVT
jgi:kynurenine formamidase